ncbi:response regulator transcription factor [Mycoplasma sp. P36-A1]|uniref:response regulator transcription factor n=1 Tax=Mycoplasma sp. P36-A1 TaxID=3252900 RepID=UPI003C2F7DF9
MFKILVVEDDKNTRKLMCAVLKMNGFDTYYAENGIVALNVLDKEQIDLIVLDIMMPVLDGYELTKSLRDVNINIPIIMVSAKFNTEDKIKGFNLGIDDYMIKPIDEQELVLRIKALLRRAKIALEKKIIINNTVVDYDSMSIHFNNQTIYLPQKEFQLLFKLLSYPGIIFTRIQLMDEIWGLDSNTNDHTVNVHINRLRDKLNDVDDFKIITVRGVGYKVEKYHE